VLLTGQGADELFGGYSWYPQLAAREGFDGFVDRSWEDTCLLFRECLEREDKISMAHSVELRVPYLDPEVIRVAFQVPPEWKIRPGTDPIGKRLHREYARWVGVPEEVALRVKEAAQHGANVHRTLEALAAQHAPPGDSLARAGYDPDRSVSEKLGSSSRYGYLYGDEHLWKPSARVQFYLDGVAESAGVLPPAARAQWRSVNTCLERILAS
jgi:asparagine synthase (glutamine-hydrolysing)